MDRREMIKKIADKYEIALMYLFGSQVKAAGEILDGLIHEVDDPLTDIDVGVVFKKDLPPPDKRILLYSDLFNELEDIFYPYPLDLVFLEENNSIFQAEAICGECIYYSSMEYKEEYEENIMRRAADFRPFLEKYYEELLEEG